MGVDAEAADPLLSRIGDALGIVLSVTFPRERLGIDRGADAQLDQA